MKLDISNLSLPVNAIINGDFNIWQRGTSFAPIVSQAYFADRFMYARYGSITHTVTRETDVPTVAQSEYQSNYSMKLDCTTALDNMETGYFTHLSYKIEGYNFIPFVGKTATLSFWVKATKTGIYCISFRNSGCTRTYISEYVIYSSDTWEKKEITIDFDLYVIGGAWNYGAGIGLHIAWMLAAGTNFHTTKDTWQTGNFLTTSNQVNACDNTNNNFSLSQVQFELGSASDFKNKSIQQEIKACQRYFCKTYDLATDPGTITNIGSHQWEERGITQLADRPHLFPVTMRTPPTVTIYSPATGAINKSRCVNSGSDIGVFSISRLGDKSFSAINHDNNFPLYSTIQIHYTADTEL